MPATSRPYESLQQSGCLALCFVFVFGAMLRFLGPFQALIFSILILIIAVISQEIRARRRLQNITGLRSGDTDDPVQVQSPLPTPIVDLSALIVREVGVDDIRFTCEICLDEIQVGEEIAGSPNKDCIHEFHYECICPALKRQPTCPCCRREYLHPQEVVPIPVETTPPTQLSPSPSQQEASPNGHDIEHIA